MKSNLRRGWLLGALSAALITASAWAVHVRLVHQACPWISAAMPRLKLAQDGLHMSGVGQLHNTGNAPALHLKSGYYVLYVPPNDTERDVYRRIKYSDRFAPLQDAGEIPARASMPFSFDSSRLAAASEGQGGIPDYLQADRYVRLLFTYRDSQGGLHHTYRCYQVAQRPNQLLSVWSCPFEDETD